MKSKAQQLTQPFCGHDAMNKRFGCLICTAVQAEKDRATLDQARRELLEASEQNARLVHAIQQAYDKWVDDNYWPIGDILTNVLGANR